MTAGEPHWLAPVRLAGGHAVLEPLADDHHDALVDAARDGELWTLGSVPDCDAR